MERYPPLHGCRGREEVLRLEDHADILSLHPHAPLRTRVDDVLSAQVGKVVLTVLVKEPEHGPISLSPLRGQTFQRLPLSASSHWDYRAAAAFGGRTRQHGAHNILVVEAPVVRVRCDICEISHPHPVELCGAVNFWELF